MPRIGNRFAIQNSWTVTTEAERKRRGERRSVHARSQRFRDGTQTRTFSHRSTNNLPATRGPFSHPPLHIPNTNSLYLSFKVLKCTNAEIGCWSEISWRASWRKICIFKNYRSNKNFQNKINSSINTNWLELIESRQVSSTSSSFKFFVLIDIRSLDLIERFHDA